MPHSTSAIRSKFLKFFQQRGHQHVASSSLVPGQDNTLLFTNAGMNQFKNVFLGVESRPYQAAVTAQRCVRAGGKHNDLENVGYTARHHTFFEMLGNFSFGAYFKKEAITYAWHFLTQELNISPEKLWITVFEEDNESENIWLHDIGIDPQRLSRIGTKDNFWQMGDTGPCGPCSEIFYDHGEQVSGGPPGTPEQDGDRYIEIWNLVFMQYNRLADGTLEPLPCKAVDTGMGLERLAAVLQHVHSNYEIDTFKHLIKAGAQIIGCSDLTNQSLCVIADHIRACSFLIADGVLPSNEGRGYVLRRIIRRAVRHGRKLGVQTTFFYQMLPPLIEIMADAYPELIAQKTLISHYLKQEEEQFTQTLDRGLALLEDSIANLNDAKELPGEIVFKLYDTHGFPADLTADILRDRGLSIDEAGFNRCMVQQQQRARKSSSFTVDYNQIIQTDTESCFVGYDDVCCATKVVALFTDGQAVNVLQSGQTGLVILAQTPFYPESGGQVGDQGDIKGTQSIFTVTNTQKSGNAIVHLGLLKQGHLKLGDLIDAHINVAKRQQAALNHSATHLLHAALREILGTHVQQKGSLVTPERLRFDFVHPQALSKDELTNIEKKINTQIRHNLPVKTQIMSLAAAKKSGALALFSEKYEDNVRVVQMGNYSKELCGGTHVKYTGEIGLFHIVHESGVATGVRRIEAISGDIALSNMQNMHQSIQSLATILKTDTTQLIDRVQQLQKNNRQLEQEINQIKSQLHAQKNNLLVNQVINVKGHNVLIAHIGDTDTKSLRTTLDMLKSKLQSAIIVLGCVQNKKVSLIAGVTKDLTNHIHAGELVNMVAQQVDGKGGGRPDMAQAGGTKPAYLQQALDSVPSWLEKRL